MLETATNGLLLNQSIKGIKGESVSSKVDFPLGKRLQPVESNLFSTILTQIHEDLIVKVVFNAKSMIKKGTAVVKF